MLCKKKIAEGTWLEHEDRALRCGVKLSLILLFLAVSQLLVLGTWAI